MSSSGSHGSIALTGKVERNSVSEFGSVCVCVKVIDRQYQSSSMKRYYTVVVSNAFLCLVLFVSCYNHMLVQVSSSSISIK